MTSKTKMKIDEELQSLQLDRPVAGKSAQQLQKHTVDAQYDNKPIERSLYILTKGDDLQKLSVIQALPQLLKTDQNATINRLIPKIHQELSTASAEFHIVTSKIFRMLIEMNSPVNLMRPILQGIECKDSSVSNAWIDTLLVVIPLLSDSIVKNEVLPSAIALSQLSRGVNYRVAATKILGQISLHPKMTSFEVKKDILPIVQSLTQDCFYEVRAAMCGELPNVAKGLGSDNVVKSSLLPGIVELSTDENMAVRASAVDAVVLMIPYLNKDTIRRTIIPLVKQLCMQSGKDNDRTFPVMARVYGMLLRNLQDHLTSQESVWFLEFFQSLSKKGLNIITHDHLDLDPALEVTCREYCAYNLPAITSFTVDQASTELGKWADTFNNLAGDPCYLVRKTVALSIHEIARILGKDNKYVILNLVKLLRDDAEEVLAALVPNIGSTLDLLCSTGFLSRDVTTQHTLEIGRALLKCQLQLFHCYNWRMKMVFLEQLEHLPNCMSSDFIHQHFTPIVLKITIEGKARPVRSQACRTMLLFLRYNIKDNHRKWIRENLINTLCYSKCCYTRHIYINMCAFALDIFSRKYFKEYFYIPLLSLAEDPVSTVRLCVVNFAPVLKHILVLPVDRNLQIKLENVLSKLEMLEKDKDVISSLKRILKEMRTAQINKPDVLMEEKRRQDEEEKIQQGKGLQNPKFGPVPVPSSRVVSRDQVLPTRTAITVPRSNTSIRRPMESTVPSSPVPNMSDMSFLGQHFYIDAGVVLPEKVDANENPIGEGTGNLEKDMDELKISSNKSDTVDGQKLDTEKVLSTISVENTNIENMSEEDLKLLETSTTNITDDVKANIQKKTLSKSSHSTEVVRKRQKRLSCVFLPEETESISNARLKRRSLNIGPHEQSRIPVSFKVSKKPDEKTTPKKSKIRSTHNTFSSKSEVLETKSTYAGLKIALKTDKSNLLSETDNVKTSNNNICKKEDRECNTSVEVKENMPISDSIKNKEPQENIKESYVAKVSNLPVLIRRTQSEVRN